MSVKSVDIVRELEDREKYSPDFHKLRINKLIPVFVFDTTKKYAADNKTYFENTEYYGDAITLKSSYLMKINEDKDPIVFESNESNCRKIIGSLYGVSPKHIIALDRFNKNNHCTHRKLIDVCALDQSFGSSLKYTNGIPIIEAWTYFGDQKWWSHYDFSDAIITQTSRPKLGQVSVYDYRKYDYPLVDDWGDGMEGAYWTNYKNLHHSHMM